MKTIVNVTTGRVLYAAQDDEEVELKSGEVIIDSTCDLPYDTETQVQVWNFESQTFSVKQKLLYD